MNCPIHNKPMRQGKFGWYCPTKNEDGSWCKYKGEGNTSPRPNSSFQGPSGEFTGHRMDPQEHPKSRNFDREAYEKCCSIWAAALMQHHGAQVSKGDYTQITGIGQIEAGEFWFLFQAIRKDGEKRFSTGWAKAEAAFRQPTTDDLPGEDPELPPLSAYSDDPQAQ